MTTVFDSDLSGQLSRRTLLVNRLDPTGTTILEPILDLVPGVTINRITADLIESESFTQSATVTENTVSNFSTRTTNSRRDLQVLQVNVLFTDIIQPGVATSIVPAVATPQAIRADLVRIRNLMNLLGRGEPVAVFTPRWAMPRAWIESISCPWGIEDGTNTRASITFKEARITSVRTGEFVQDYESQSSGANTRTGGGKSPTREINLSNFQLGAEAQNAPVVS